MKTMLLAGMFTGVAVLATGCGRNEPGTMGGEPATPRTVATGAPAEAAKGSAVSDADTSALQSEQSMSSFDDSVDTNGVPPTLQPQASPAQIPTYSEER